MKTYKTRRYSDITGICLHQTATRLLKKNEISEKKIARALRRAYGINAHYVILRDGAVAQPHGITTRTPSGQRVFNASDVHIEIDGWYAGVEGRRRTFWKPKSRPLRKPLQPTKRQVEATLRVIRGIIDEVSRCGGEIQYIHAHRQTSKWRKSDPGQLIWQAVAIPAMLEHGLSDGGNSYYVPRHPMPSDPQRYSSAGPGKPIPREWDPRRTTSY